MQRAITIAVLATAAMGGAWYASRAPQAPPVVVAVAPASSPGPITVHISGAVRSPGLVELAANARVADAVAAAGGAAPFAELDGLNLAAAVVDGQQVVVPTKGEAATSQPGTSGKLRLNSATVQELETLAGVGPVLAARIVAHRDEWGPFAIAEDLLDVSGIGEAKLADLREQLEVP